MYRIPRLDVKEKDSKYIVIMEIPRVDQATIEIKTQNGELVVRANVSELLLSIKKSPRILRDFFRKRFYGFE